MKRKILIFVILLTGTGLFVLQSCFKDGEILATYNTFAIPVAVAPVDNSNIAPATNVDLTWFAVGGTVNKWDVYFGESESPDLYASDQTSQTINVPVVEGHTYYWYVYTEDANGIPTTSPVFTFTVKVTLDINNFVGLYDCDEPGYAHYDCTFTLINSTTVENNNFWDSGYAVQYVFDDMGNVTIITKTINVSSTKTYTIDGSGTYNNATGEFVVDYTVVQKVYAYANYALTVTSTTVDSNTHTFVPK